MLSSTSTRRRRVAVVGVFAATLLAAPLVTASAAQAHGAQCAHSGHKAANHEIAYTGNWSQPWLEGKTVHVHGYRHWRKYLGVWVPLGSYRQICSKH